MADLNRRRLLCSLVPLITVGGAVAEERHRTVASPAQPRATDRLPDPLLVSHRGQSLRFYSDLIADRPVIINLMYTQCAGTCPGTSALLSSLWPALDQAVGPDLRIISITLDPEHDNPEVLAACAEALRPRNADQFRSDWVFLTGQPDDIESIRRGLGFTDPDPAIDRDRSQHSALITFGNDRLNRWATMPVETRREQIQKSIIRILRGTAAGGVR
ncbi:MAG: SCO family protein [Planctomycetota bacterium]